MRYLGKKNHHKKAAPSKPNPEAKTSWGTVADWYEEHLKDGNTYHEHVIAPNIRRLLEPHKGKPILEVGCGEGFITRILAEDGHTIMGSDISPELIIRARSHSDRVSYHVAPAEKLAFAADSIFAAAIAVLSLQNMERIEAPCLEISRVLMPRGRFIGVINHPAFRIPGRSSWGFDEARSIQYRRLDGYLSADSVKIDMRPGAREKEITYTYHRSLQDYTKALRAAGFAIIRMEEWISHRESGEGPRKQAEDTARKEFPLFLAFEAMKVSPAGRLE